MTKQTQPPSTPPKQKLFCALPGGAAHIDAIAGAAQTISEEADIIGWAASSAGFLVELMHAFGAADRLLPLMLELLQKNRVLDIAPDGKLGLCRWEVIADLIGLELGASTTLGESPVPLVCCVTNVDTGGPLYLSSWTHPRVKLTEAGRATSAIHPLAPFVRIPSLGTPMSPDIRLFIDGGFTDNLPDHIFDALPERTVSVKLEDSGEIFRVREGDPLGQALSIVRAVTFAQSNRKSTRRDTINIDVAPKGSGLNFSKREAEVHAGWDSGRAAVAAAVKRGAFDVAPRDPAATLDVRLATAGAKEQK